MDLLGKTLQLEIMDGVDDGVDAWTGPKCDITLYIMISQDRKSTRLNSSHPSRSRMPSSA